MITKLNCPISYNSTDLSLISSLTNPLSQHWDTPNDNKVKELKKKIRKYLDDNQGSCGYCGLELGGTAGGEIDHIAPKGKSKYHPEFTFEAENLVLACEHCNGPKKKFIDDPIKVKDSVYNKCTFKFVHPYFSDPNDHYDWVDKAKRIIIQKKTDEGEYSINLFDLASPKMTKFRAQELLSESFANEYNLDDDTKQEIKDALKK